MENSEETKSVSTAPASDLSGIGEASSIRLLIAVNVVVAAGVLFFGWDAFNVVFLFWLENLVIGFFTVLKMVTANASKMNVMQFVVQMSGGQIDGRMLDQLEAAELESAKVPFARISRFFLVPFFCCHYGLFMLVHGLFIVLLLGDGAAALHDGGFVGILTSCWHYWMWAVLAGLVLEHGREFLGDYLGKEKNKQTAAVFQMFAPYGRIVVMHLVIIAGAFLVISLGLPRLLAVLLVVVKTLMELVRKKRQRAANLKALSASGG